MSFNSYKEDENVSTAKKSVTIKRLLSYLLVYKKEIAVVFVILAYTVGQSLINPLFVEWALDDYLVPKNFSGLVKLLLIAFAVNIVGVILVKIRMAIMAKVSNGAVKTIREEVFTKLQTLDFTFFDSRPTGKILSRVMDDVNSLKEVLTQFVLTLIPEFTTVVAVLVIMLVKDYRLAFASMVGLPILIGGLFTIECLCRVRWQIRRKKASNLNAFIHEDISGIRIVKTFAAEEETLKTFDELNKDSTKSFLNAVRIGDGFNSVIEISQAISLICMVYVGVVKIGIDSLSVGLLVAFITYTTLFWQPIANLGSFYTQIITSLAAAERVFEVIDTKSLIQDK